MNTVKKKNLKSNSLLLGITYGFVITILYLIPDEILSHENDWRTLRTFLTIPIVNIISIFAINEMHFNKLKYHFRIGLWKTIKIGLVGNFCYVLFTFTCNYLPNLFKESGLNDALIKMPNTLADAFFYVILLLIFGFIAPLYIKITSNDNRYEDIIDGEL